MTAWQWQAAQAALAALGAALLAAAGWQLHGERVRARMGLRVGSLQRRTTLTLLAGAALVAARAVDPYKLRGVYDETALQFLSYNTLALITVYCVLALYSVVYVLDGLLGAAGRLNRRVRPASYAIFAVAVVTANASALASVWVDDAAVTSGPYMIILMINIGVAVAMFNVVAWRLRRHVRKLHERMSSSMVDLAAGLESGYGSEPSDAEDDAAGGAAAGREARSDAGSSAGAPRRPAPQKAGEDKDMVSIDAAMRRLRNTMIGATMVFVVFGAVAFYVGTKAVLGDQSSTARNDPDTFELSVAVMPLGHALSLVVGVWHSWRPVPLGGDRRRSFVRGGGGSASASASSSASRSPRRAAKGARGGGGGGGGGGGPSRSHLSTSSGGSKKESAL